MVKNFNDLKYDDKRFMLLICGFLLDINYISCVVV